MATGRNSDLVPLRKDTKRRLADVKQDASYDEAIRALLDLVPPDAVRARLRAERAATPPPQAPPSAWREPEKQRLVAELAEEAWRAWVRTGRVREMGPRMVSWSALERPEGGTLRVVARPGRGLPA